MTILGKILPWAAGVSAAAALLFALLWRLAVAHQATAEVQRDRAVDAAARCTVDLGGEKAARAEESKRCEADKANCVKDVRSRDDKIMEWSATAPRGAAGAMLGWVLSHTDACDLPSDDLLSPAGAVP